MKQSATAAARPDAAGFVLAGGQSSRMGRDKALLLFAGQPLAANALSILREAGLAASIAGARSSLADFAPVIADAQPGMGPLSGICAALASTTARHAVFLPVDLPLLPASLVAILLRHAQTTGRAVTVAAVGGFAQTFPAVLDRAVLPALRAELDAGRRGCFAAFQTAAASLGQSVAAIPAEFLAQSGHAVHPGGLPAACWFLNVNTPEDLLRPVYAAAAARQATRIA
jgi:molybdopterin-guanine dinucleotide biosynthesis protein A